jgi:hypothetical protein
MAKQNGGKAAAKETENRVKKQRKSVLIESAKFGREKRA